MNCDLIPIGKFEITNGETIIKVYQQYHIAMEGLAEFSHLQILWWFDRCDNENCRNKLIEEKPYKNGPELLGAFATRTPERPNPIAVSTIQVLAVDVLNGIIRIPYADAFSGTPILDIKPYIPCVDRVEKVQLPNWCNHWPKSVEMSGEFDWSAEFNF